MQNYSEIIEYIEELNAEHSDEIVHSKDLRCVTRDWHSENVQFKNTSTDEVISFNDIALSQLLNRLGIPVRFFNKNPAYLRKDIFNHWIFLQQCEYLFRLTANFKVRAVLTSKYGIIDNIVVFPTIIHELMDINTYPRYFTNTDCITRMSVCFPDTKVIIHNNQYEAGMTITNSETGHSSVWVEPAIFMNNFIFHHRAGLRNEDINLRIVHKGNIETDRIKEMASDAKEAAQVGIVQLAETSQQNISTAHAIDFIRSINPLGSKLRNIIIEDWETQQTLNKMTVMQEILQAAKDLPILQTIAVEQQVGRFSGVFKNYRSRLANMVHEVANLS